MNFSKLWEIVKGREAWSAVVYEVTNSHTWLIDWTTNLNLYLKISIILFTADSFSSKDNQFSSVQSLSHVQLFVTPWLPCPLPTPTASVQFSRSVVFDSAIPWTAACQASLSITNSWSLLKLMSIESVVPSNHVIHCCTLFLPPSIFPSIRVFSKESVLHIRWPKYWSFSFSISPSNEHSGLISFRMTGLILQSKGLSRVFSNTTVWKHQFFGAQRSLWSISHICTWLLEKP